MSLVKVLSILLLLSISYDACTPVKALSSMYKKQAAVFEFKNDSKTLKFIPMHHVGKPEFYISATTLVKFFKEQGYIVYFESAKSDRIEDSVLKETYQRKFRKMMGLYIDSTGYGKYFENSSLFRNMTGQPTYKELGVSDNDIKVDVPQNKLVDAYEEIYGTIQLEPGDKQIPLSSSYPGSLRLPKDKVRTIIIDHRNHHLAEYIQRSNDRQIVILYGAIHVDGTFSELYKLDNHWKKN